MENKLNIYERLMNIQQELKAPKSQYNKFGNYKYRNCEDILESVKPLLKKYNLILALNDEMVYLGERYYVKATATLYSTDTGEEFTNSALAREEESKKGMDGSQITGASSSYARKYALNGLFAIDDTKDSDTTNIGESDKSKANEKATDKQVEFLTKHYQGEDMKKLLEINKLDKIENITKSKAADLISKILEKEKNKEK